MTEGPMTDDPMLMGADALRAALPNIPQSAGVYRMMDAADRVLYVGKAKHLRNRVTSYTLTTNLSTRIMRMVQQVARVDILTCASEAEALLLEASLIKRHRPHYNILLKDDKTFPHLEISRTHAFPRIAKHRGAQDAAQEYFGPFASVNALNQTLALLQKIFQLRPCSDSYFAHRSRPCLQYQIKRCSAPCVGLISAEDYAAQLARARDFLRGKHRQVQEELAVQMQAASAAMEYEQAALLRDRIAALTQIQQEQRLQVAGLVDADVVALASAGGRTVVQVAFYRQGAPFGHQSFHPTHAMEDSPSAILSGFLAQFYGAHTPPPELLISHPLGAEEEGEEARALLEEALQLRAGYRVEIRVPQRGDKRALMDAALRNATLALTREAQEKASLRTQLEGVQKLFALAELPTRIEVYDNSHIMGTHAIGAMIVATPEGFEKSSYRTFKMEEAGLVAGDDYGMMRAMFRRRLKGASPEHRPSLLLVDGGKGQLAAVCEVMAELGCADIPVVGIAKGEDRNAGREWFFLPDRTPFQLPPNDPVLHYLQRLRDEAHRFAIGTHRRKRAKSLTASSLDDIAGIGATRKRALLLHFGSRAAVETASLAELMQVEGISRKMAETMIGFFQKV